MKIFHSFFNWIVPGVFSITYRIISNSKHQQRRPERRCLIEDFDVIRFFVVVCMENRQFSVVFEGVLFFFFITWAPYQRDTRNLPSDTPNLTHLPSKIIIIIHIIPEQ